MELSLLSCNVGLPRVIGAKGGAPVISSFDKRPVGLDRIRVRPTNIEGDAQADLRVHGGVDKAVYAYCADRWEWWEREHRLSCGPGTFGENLTLSGANETDIAIGDRFRWGDVLLEVSQPRAPCFKLGMRVRADIPQLMTIAAHCGWYLRVIEEGSAPVRDAKLSRVSHHAGPNVRETFIAALHPGAPRELLLRVRDAPALAGSWRDAVSRRIAVAPTE